MWKIRRASGPCGTLRSVQTAQNADGASIARSRGSPPIAMTGSGSSIVAGSDQSHSATRDDAGSRNSRCSSADRYRAGSSATSSFAAYRRPCANCGRSGRAGPRGGPDEARDRGTRSLSGRHTALPGARKPARSAWRSSSGRPSFIPDDAPRAREIEGHHPCDPGRTPRCEAALAGRRPGQIGIVRPGEERPDAEPSAFDAQGREVTGACRAFRALTT
jgi:hypothetical protein